MAGSGPRAGRRDRRDEGQVLVLFCISVVAMLVAMALLYDGARALVLRRQLQNAAEAAALAGANVIASGNPQGCASNGVIRTAVATAAKNSVKTNLGWTDANVASNVVVSCSTDPNFGTNLAVTVAINATAPTYFGRIAGRVNMAVGASGTAINGSLPPGRFSVMQLDPSNLTWPNGYRGCPSILFSGGPNVIFEGSVQSDSACTAANGGSIGTNGNSATITLVSPAKIQMVGTYTPGPLVITPAPIQNSAYVPDPLAGLPAIPTLANATTAGSPKTVVGNGQNPTCSILEPGTYPGGIEVKSQGAAWLRPGIYIMAGGGISIGAQGAIYTLSNDTNITNCGALDSASWDTALCRADNCGVLVYNTSTGTGANAVLGPLDLGGGSSIKMRAYNPLVDRTNTNRTEYKNLMFWQDANACSGASPCAAPIPSSTYHQPVLSLRGGGTAYLQGTVYAPSGQVSLGGNCGGTGGTPLELTLQFISWDLEINGSCTFHFIYSVDGFTSFPTYGLVK
jgi:Flp pilus assembly protein TadG